MNPEEPMNPREELEAQITALLLGELSAAQAKKVRKAIAEDEELQQLRDRLEQTIGLVHEASATMESEADPEAEPIKFSGEKREQLLARFKTKSIPGLKPTTARSVSWIVQAGIAAALVALLGMLAIPNFQRAKSTSVSTAMINNLRQIDGAKQRWAMENNKSSDAVPTQSDLKPYLKVWPEPMAGEEYMLGAVSEPVTAEVDARGAKKRFSELKLGKLAEGEVLRISSDGSTVQGTHYRQLSQLPAERASEEVARSVLTPELQLQRGVASVAPGATGQRPDMLFDNYNVTALPASYSSDRSSYVGRPANAKVPAGTSLHLNSVNSSGLESGSRRKAKVALPTFEEEAEPRDEFEATRGWARSTYGETSDSRADGLGGETSQHWYGRFGNGRDYGAGTSSTESSYEFAGIETAADETLAFGFESESLNGASASGGYPVRRAKGVTMSSPEPTTEPVESYFARPELAVNEVLPPAAAPTLPPVYSAEPAARLESEWRTRVATSAQPTPKFRFEGEARQLVEEEGVSALALAKKRAPARPQPGAPAAVEAIAAIKVESEPTDAYIVQEEAPALGLVANETTSRGLQHSLGSLDDNLERGREVGQGVTRYDLSDVDFVEAPTDSAGGRVAGKELTWGVAPEERYTEAFVTDEEAVAETLAQVPVLGDVPAMGRMFRSTTSLAPPAKSPSSGKPASVESNFMFYQDPNRDYAYGDISGPTTGEALGGGAMDMDAPMNRSLAGGGGVAGGTVMESSSAGMGEPTSKSFVAGYAGMPDRAVEWDDAGLVALDAVANDASFDPFGAVPTEEVAEVEFQLGQQVEMLGEAVVDEVQVASGVEGVAGGAYYGIPTSSNVSSTRGGAVQDLNEPAEVRHNVDREQVTALYAVAEPPLRQQSMEVALADAIAIDGDRSREFYDYDADGSLDLLASTMTLRSELKQNVNEVARGEELERQVLLEARLSEVDADPFAGTQVALPELSDGQVDANGLVQDAKLLYELGRVEEAAAKLASIDEALTLDGANQETWEYRELLRNELAKNESKLVAGLVQNRGTLVAVDKKSDVAKKKLARQKEVEDLAASKEAAVTEEKIRVQKKLEEDKALRRVAEAPVPQPEILTSANAFSTFSLNVADVSFKLAAASLEQGTMPDVSTIRSEEFINAFDYRDPAPMSGQPIAFKWERARYPFAHNRDLMRFSVQTAAKGREAGQPLNLVLLLDNSGSMERADRVAIIQECLRVLGGKLTPQDKVSVVSFARTARLWVDGLPGVQAPAVPAQAGTLTPQGGTNLEEAMNLAYATAERHYLPYGVNRVVLLTDGAANLGEVDPEALKLKVEANRKQGIALDAFGIGWEGYNDDLLEVLTRNGDGRYGFVNTIQDAASEFAGQLAGALQVAASDVKVQVEFNAARVKAYRQIGYAKHQLKKEQFRDNTVDAAEIGAAESGNALYVVETDPNGEGPMATVRVRYKVPATGEYLEYEWVVPYAGEASDLEKASEAMRLAATASAFSEWLVSSPYAGEVTTDALLGYLRGVPQIYGADPRPQKLETMIREAGRITGN